MLYREIIHVLRDAYIELNAIRARDGIPYDSLGNPYGVSKTYFSDLVDRLDYIVSNMNDLWKPISDAPLNERVLIYGLSCGFLCWSNHSDENQWPEGAEWWMEIPLAPDEDINHELNREYFVAGKANE